MECKAKILDTTTYEGEGTRESWEVVEQGRDTVRWHFGGISIVGKMGGWEEARGLIRARAVGWTWGERGTEEQSSGRKFGEE